MYQKINILQNIAIVLIGAVLFSIAFTLLNFPAIAIISVLLGVIVICTIIILRTLTQFKETISHTQNVVANSVKQAVELEKLSVFMVDEKTNKVSWQNEYTTSNFGDLLNKDINELFNGKLLIKEETDTNNTTISCNNKCYSIIKDQDAYVLKDITSIVESKEKYINNKDCLIYLRIDSIDEISETLEEITYLNIIQGIRSLISDFANEFDSLLRRYKSDSYIMVVKQKEIDKVIEKAKIVLEKAKDENPDFEDKITISMGIAYDFDTLKDTQYEAGAALDMALARGGDQIVVKRKNESYEFLGGNSEATEKRNRVKVKMIASSLEVLISAASNVVIMPHRNADMDALGAAYGFAKFVRINNKKAYIVADINTLEINTQNAYDTLDLSEEHLMFKENEILEIVDKDTLLVIVDTSNADLLESTKVYQAIDKRVVIDHHRRGENFIDKPLLVYIESYASSAVELVTEILRFQTKSYKLNSNVATLMLAGMMIDTSYFTVRTGVRTFDAAAMLRDRGANPLDAKELLQVNIDTYQKRLAIVSDAQFYEDKIAISTYDKEPVSRALLAQSAVELLNVKDIVATFVIGKINDDSIGISARSNGDFNVQHILEYFGGGGHFSMAAAQINNKSIEEIKTELLEQLKEKEEGK
ncbi:DHH family phosphoesterase [Mycoplasma sp. P36-A1]|uniref:DHH family phosphoesterase n=1 Tax=Mycoplasma sp. P36-A1 TaxID=3252900 RepID=UPI003C2C6B4A